MRKLKNETNEYINYLLSMMDKMDTDDIDEQKAPLIMTDISILKDILDMVIDIENAQYKEYLKEDINRKKLLLSNYEIIIQFMNKVGLNNNLKTDI